MQPALPFDYEALDADTRSAVQGRTDKIRGLMRRAAQDIVDIGLELIGVKEDLPHGCFGPWLRAEFEWSQDTAGRFMNVAHRFGEIPHGAEFEARALYLLAAPSTPEAARGEALALAESGEQVTYARAREIVQNHQPPQDIGHPIIPPEVVTAGDEEGEADEDLLAAQDQAEEDLAAWESGEDDEDGEDDGDDDEAPADEVPDDPPQPDPEPAPPLVPTRAGRWPHSERLVHWLRTVSSQTHVVNVEMGGIRAMLAERDKWDWRDVREFILPMLTALGVTIETFRAEIESHANETRDR